MKAAFTWVNIRRTNYHHNRRGNSQPRHALTSNTTAINIVMLPPWVFEIKTTSVVSQRAGCRCHFISDDTALKTDRTTLRQQYGLWVMGAQGFLGIIFFMSWLSHFSSSLSFQAALLPKTFFAISFTSCFLLYICLQTFPRCVAHVSTLLLLHYLGFHTKFWSWQIKQTQNHNSKRKKEL